MSSYTVCAWGESMSVTVLELNDDERSTAIRIFDAVNATADINDNYSPLVFLFAGSQTYDDIGRLRPINDTHWRGTSTEKQ